jgi:hypothetical protein
MSPHSPLDVQWCNAKTRWCWILGCGNKCVVCLFRYNANLYIQFWRMLQCSPLIAVCLRLTIVDTLLTLTWITSKQPIYTHELYVTNHIRIFDIQYYVCMHYCLHPGVLLPHTFWSTAIYAFWVRNDMALIHSSAFGRQLMASRSFH